MFFFIIFYLKEIIRNNLIIRLNFYIIDNYFNEHVEIGKQSSLKKKWK